jgi:hypothetical protein
MSPCNDGNRDHTNENRDQNQRTLLHRAKFQVGYPILKAVTQIR